MSVVQCQPRTMTPIQIRVAQINDPERHRRQELKSRRASQKARNVWPLKYDPGVFSARMGFR